MSSFELSHDELRLAANTVRMLSAEGVERANSGHPGMPMGVADYGVVLWLKYLQVNPDDLGWLNRDRFVLSNGHGSMFLYSMLHLMGYDLTIDDLKAFRQWGSKTPGHPESHLTPGVECTTGPLGQGISNAVGMALGEKTLRARYNTPEHQIVDHRVFAIVGDGCLMEGVSGEASSVAGHLGLGNLIAIYDDNHISIAGSTELAFTEDVAKRYEAYGWHTERIDGHDFDAIDGAIQRAIAEVDRPSMICARTTIGKGSPNKANTHGVHGAPLGSEELAATRAELGWTEEPFVVPEEVQQLFSRRIRELKEVHQRWSEQYTSWSEKNGEKAAELERQRTYAVPADLTEKLIAAVPQGEGKAIATRKLSEAVLQVASAEVTALFGGSADLEPSTLTLIKDSTDIQKERFSGKNIRFGVREHGMGAIMNGLSYYGSFIPYGSTFLVFSDYMRPTVRLAALSHLRGLFVYTHDSVFLGEDGPTHQPIEHLNSLRMIPNLNLFRPADGVETAVSYSLALQREEGPSALIFTRHGLPPISRPEGFDYREIERGAYTVFESEGVSDARNVEVVLVATGSEVHTAIAAAALLAGRTRVRVVSMPCAELFTGQPEEFRTALIPPAAKKVVIEAGLPTGWLDILEADSSTTELIGLRDFGASAPYSKIVEEFGFLPEQIAKRVQERFSL